MPWIDGYQYYLLDFKYSRYVLLTFPDSDATEKLVSTLNLD